MIATTAGVHGHELEVIHVFKVWSTIENSIGHRHGLLHFYHMSGDEKPESIERRVDKIEWSLVNGVKTFDAIWAVLDEVKPKPFAWSKAVFPFAGLVIAILSAWWTLSNLFADRPTHSDVAAIMKAHVESAGHPELILQLRDLQKQLSDTARVVDKMSAVQDAMHEDLKALKTHGRQ